MTPEALDGVLSMLRRQGVSHFRDVPGEGFDVTFFPAQPASEPEQKPAAAVVDIELCKCGHPVHAHVNGLCIHSCDVEKCAPEEQKP